MRSWIFGGLLTAVTASGVSFVAAGVGNPNHCGPCSSCRPVIVPAAQAGTTPAEPEVGLEATPKRLAPVVSYDEPPLANPAARLSGEIIPATYTEPVGGSLEQVPRPRSNGLAIPLATPNDPF